MEFEKFPSIKRLKRDCVITEKLDGTNGQIMFDVDGGIMCGSRTRIIVPGDDNYGFAKWAYENKEALFEILGEGRHYGEWWGQGVQRRYGLQEKRFSLFNTGRWNEDNTQGVDQLHVVPQLNSGEFSTEMVDDTFDTLKENGSFAVPGWSKPEGIVIYHTQIKEMFKVTFEHDQTGKTYGA